MVTKYELHARLRNSINSRFIKYIYDEKMFDTELDNIDSEVYDFASINISGDYMTPPVAYRFYKRKEKPMVRKRVKK